MSLKIRLARGGAKGRPYYRIVVANSRSPRDGRFIEKVGTYNPMVAKDHADRLTLNEDRIKHWLSIGAEPTDRLARFFGQKNLMAMPDVSHNPTKGQPKKKAQERLKEQAKRDEAAQQAAEEARQAAEAPIAVTDPVESDTPAVEEVKAEETEKTTSATE